MKRILIGIAVATLFFAAIPAGAATITLYNTGVDDGSALLGLGATDSHYQIVASPGSAYGLAYTPLSDTTFPFPSWFAQGPSSKWISPLADATITVPDGYYTYRTTFDLSGLNPSTASITGQWSTDNEGFGIFLNGASKGFAIPLLTSYTSFHSFSISGSGFAAGSNNLDFVVWNEIRDTGNPSGLRVELSGTATPVPEPGTMMLLGSGLIGLAGWGRKKFRK